MATLSRDNGSDWRAGGVRRRDFRHSKDGPEAPRRASPRRRKDTRRWCRGVVGREHAMGYRERDYGVMVFRDRVCASCGRVFWGPESSVVRRPPAAPVDLSGSVWTIQRVV